MQMTIGQVAARTGLRPSALRYYESVGLLPKPGRVSGTRRYDPDVLELLAGIRVAQQAGFTVAEIKRLFYGFPASTAPADRWRALASKKVNELEELIGRAQGMQKVLEEGIRCGCTSFRECTLLGQKRG